MPRKIEGQPAYVLHSRPYRNTSLIVEMFTADMGRQTVVARSARGLKSRYQGQLQSFVPLLIAYTGQGELKSLSVVELTRRPYDLIGREMMCGFYLNELLLRLLQKGDEHKGLFSDYENTLHALEDASQVELNLRLFENRLLAKLGYAINCRQVAGSSAAIEPETWYRFVPDQGFVILTSAVKSRDTFVGDSLLALASEQLVTPTHFSDAKRLMRQALAVHLGPKPLKSRECL